MPISHEESHLAQELAFDEAVLLLVKPHTVGEFRKYDAAFVHPDSPYDERESGWLIAKASETLRADNYAKLDALRDQIQPFGYLPFLLEDYGDVGDGAYVAVLKSPDKMEIVIQSGIAGAGANYDMYDDRFLEIVRDWDTRFGIAFVSLQGHKGAEVSIKFHRMPDDLHVFLGEATDFCPTLLELATSEAEQWENMEEFAATRVLSLWWD